MIISKRQQLVAIYKKNKTLIKLIFAVISIIILGTAVSNIYKEIIMKQDIINLWEQQLPEDHFLNDKSWWDAKEFSTLQSKLKEYVIGTKKVSEKIIVTKMGKMSVLYYVYRFCNIHKTNYFLYNYSEKEIQEIKLKLGDTVQVSLFRDEEEMSFKLKEEDFENVPISSDKLVDWIFPEDYVMAFVEDTGKAKINENCITGLKTGSTTLDLFIDNILLKYKITIE